MISIKQIHYALAVSKTKHFKKAAEQCAVSQSTLSSAISELENQLNLTIFERDNKKVLITASGYQFLEKAKQVKALVDDIALLSNNQNSLFSYPLTLGVIPTIGPYLLPKVLPHIRAAHPDLRLNIVEQQSEVLVDKVRSGDIDTAILALPYPLNGLHTFKFWEEDFYYVSHAEDSVTQHCDFHEANCQITVDDIDPQHLMLLEDGHCLKDHILAVCKMSQLERNSAFSGASLYTLTQMVASQMGSTLIPEMALDQLVSDSNELSAKRLNEPSPHREIAFITRLNYPGVSNIERLMMLCADALNNYRVHT